MSSADRVSVMLVDDHSIVRDGLKAVLERSGEFEVIGQAGDGDEAVRTAEGLAPDVVVMDVLMPGKDGVEACREIMALLPDTRVLVLTASTEEDAVIEAIKADNAARDAEHGSMRERIGDRAKAMGLR